MAICPGCNCEHHEGVCGQPYPLEDTPCVCEVCRCFDCTGEEYTPD
jgi:hypothetical protein